MNKKKYSALVLALVAILSQCLFGDGTVRTNPPSACSDPQNGCGCPKSEDEEGKGDGTEGEKSQNDGDSTDDECIKVWLGLGRTTPWTGSMACSLKIFADDESSSIFTCDSLYAVLGGYTFKRLGQKTMSDGVTPAEVVMSHPRGESVHFVFAEGESWGRPDPGVHVKMDERLMMVDAEGWATTIDPVYYDLYVGDGTRRRFLATNMTGALGQLVSITDARGVTETPEDMGVDIVYDSNGVRQFLTPSRLADIVQTADFSGYDIAIYAIDAAPARDASTGLYALPAAQPVKRLSLRSANGGKRAVVTIRRGGGEPMVNVFDYAMGEWSLTRPSGVKEEKERLVQDMKAAQIVKEVKSTSGELLSRRESNFKWMSWGFAMTNRVDGFDGVTDTTSWTYYTSGNGKGQVKTERRQSGLLIQYAYDNLDRLVSLTRSGLGMMTETTTYDYTPVDPSDPMLPVDTRPRTVIRKLNNIECERTYYVYSPLTNIVERVGEQGAAYGGTNVLRTVTTFYPVSVGASLRDARSGFVASVRNEDGKLDLYDYALSSNTWIRTVTHLHEQSPSPVSGKTTRDITLTNARGETTETRTEAFIDGIWYTIARNRMTYNAEGKRTSLENLAGQVTTTAWDCCHKVSEVQPDGSTTTWDYDDEGRITATSRLIPLDMTNVTWLTTCYRYDALGRQTATWQTNFTAQVGLPATRIAYDQLGRAIARIDQLGNTTTTTYSPDGRTLSVLNPNTSTRITTRSASGDILSISGTAVTPEFHTYGILPDGTRWSKTVQGETADSPRLTKRYDNLLGQTIREERSGFKGATLATIHTYDVYSHLVSTITDGEPMIEKEFNDLGKHISTTMRVASGEWRRESMSEGFERRGTDIWSVVSNIADSSDVAIATLAQSSASRLTGFSLNQVAQSSMVDARGNAIELHTEYDGFVTRKARISPEQATYGESYYRNGVLVRFVSESGIENRLCFDGLGRQVLFIDGRGKTVRTKYDAQGLRVSTIDANGFCTAYAYNRFGELIAETNAAGEVVSYCHDLRGRKIYEGGATYPIRYGYDIFGNKVSMTTYRNEGVLEGDLTRWLYDESSGLVTNKVYADGMGVSYDYDSYGRLVKRTWARGIETMYTYNAWGLLARMDYSDSTPSVVLSYDAMGRLIRALDAAGITTFAYDGFSANTNETVIGVAGTNTIERFFDNFGRNIGYSLNGVRQSTLAYHPANGRIATMFANGSATPFTWNYLTASEVKSSLAYPNGLTASWQHDANGQLLQVRNAMPTNVISQFDYSYDSAGRRVNASKSGEAFDQKDTIAYGYNTRSELTNVIAAYNASYRYGYQFDDIGNRESANESGTNFAYVANSLNQYTAVNDFTPEYDEDGNQTLVKTTTGIWAVTYNGENRPVYWTQGTNTISMSYDRMGRRVVKNDQRFVYNGHRLIAKYSQSSSNNHFFVWDPTEPAATCPLVWNCGGSVSYYAHDGNRNVSEIVAWNGAVDAHYEYAPFGTITAQRGSSATANPWRFSSEFADDDLAMTYYNFRHYMQQDGRWLSRDLIEEMGGAGLYCFLANNSTSFNDILGLKKNKEVECDKEHVGMFRADVATRFSVAGQDPDELDEKINLILAFLLLYDIPLPGKDDLSSIALAQYNAMVSKYPGGADIVAEIIKNRSKLKEVLTRSSEKEVWSKVKCQECKCRNRFLSWIGLQSPQYSWETIDESDWIKCDISETKWGKSALRRQDHPLNKDGTLSPVLTPSDKKQIREQCGEQARKYCDAWMDD